MQSNLDLYAHSVIQYLLIKRHIHTLCDILYLNNYSIFYQIIHIKIR